MVPAGATQRYIAIASASIAPGQKLLITGSHWPAGTGVAATLCGADAQAGTADCAETTTVLMVAPRTGRLWVLMTTALPPKPCPCVILVTETTGQYIKRIPIAVEGAKTVPVQKTSIASAPALTITGLKVVGGITLASAFGGAAPRTVEFRIRNTGTQPVAPVLLGRWGSGTQITHVIEMPIVAQLGPGVSETIRAHFSLPALSVGNYTVKVEAQAIGSGPIDTATASTSTWPFALFIVALVLLGLLLLGIEKMVQNRRRRREQERLAKAGQEAPDALTAQPAEQVGLDGLGAKVAAASAVGAVAAEGAEDAASQLE